MTQPAQTTTVPSCLCSHPKAEHSPFMQTCRRPGCGCTHYRPREDAAMHGKARGMMTDDHIPAIRASAVDIPGLFDVDLPDGRRLFDMTVGQVENVARRNGWRIECVRAFPVGSLGKNQKQEPSS